MIDFVFPSLRSVDSFSVYSWYEGARKTKAFRDHVAGYSQVCTRVSETNGPLMISHRRRPPSQHTALSNNEGTDKDPVQITSACCTIVISRTIQLDPFLREGVQQE
jgi:hypothetical protein